MFKRQNGSQSKEAARTQETRQDSENLLIMGEILSNFSSLSHKITWQLLQLIILNNDVIIMVILLSQSLRCALTFVSDLLRATPGEFTFD